MIDGTINKGYGQRIKLHMLQEHLNKYIYIFNCFLNYLYQRFSTCGPQTSGLWDGIWGTQAGKVVYHHVSVILIMLI